MDTTQSYNNIREKEVFKPSSSNDSPSSKDSSNRLLSKILKSKEDDNLKITNVRGKLKDNYYIFIPIRNEGTWEFVILFDKGIIKEIKLESNFEDDIFSYYIELSNQEKEILNLKQNNIEVVLDISLKEINFNDIEPLYHLRLGIFDNSLFTKINELCNLDNERFKLKPEYDLSIVSNGTIVNSKLKSIYYRYCTLLKKFYVNEDIFYPISFSFYCNDIL